ncbi:unnamed protein product [Rotaria socialis]|uniref:phosphatidylinositol-3,5-bisphosphate 3-phosphatase n=1 Tax=Rotaria socialis TaxID=392032 RepID=A0A818RQM3_9BILA|nr:unnamed protein product [Rotaria socialis]CAF4677383.1 unnamed protein product [Rotaria socialis]
MFGDADRDKMNKLKRSNSHESIPLQSLTTLVRSKPTSNDADRLSSNAKDNNVSKLPLNDDIVSSPYENASSATNVLNLLPLAYGGLRGSKSEQELTMSIPEQQQTVAFTKDLSLPMNFLSGEEDVKLREYVTYHSQEKVPYRGELIVTKYRLLFVTKSPDPIQILVNVPIGMIGQIEKIGGQTRSNISDSAAYGIGLTCKDLRYIFFANSKEQHQRRNLFDNLNRLAFPFSISKGDIKKPLAFYSSFFAWNYKQKMCPNEIDEGWKLFNKIKEYTRMGIQRTGDSHWKIDTEINKYYQFCDTYPDTIVIPSNFEASRLQYVATFRSRNRIPVLSWYSSSTFATITRASQPLTGLNRKCQHDIDYLHEIANTNLRKGSELFIFDARPKVNAIANKAQGGGYEDYPECGLEFQNIQNIHVMRESLNKLHISMRSAPQDDKTWLNDLENSNWLFHIRAILTSANRLVSLVFNDERSVLVHCSDGWDRTAQLTSLAMLMLDGYYRTLKGFMILIEKEWVSFGHKFLCRIGHGDKIESERSPVFIQFLDCTYQLLQQFPSAFEINEQLLLAIADYLYSCQYGTFLQNSEKLRTDMKLSEHTMSVWTPILRDRQAYINKNYNKNSNETLLVNSTHQIKLWKNYYCRYYQ